MTAAPPLVVIAGATATGKTDLAIRLAEAVGAGGRPVAVISADSRQVFRGLDIGTAKATAADRARVPHHGLDLVDPDEPFSVADFATHARAHLADLNATDGIAILAGGTGLYLRSIATGLDTDAPAERPGRPRRGSRPSCRPMASMRWSPASGRVPRTRPRSVDLRNPRRVVRALEIAELSGDTPRPPALGYGGPLVWIGLTVDPAAHADRIATRARAQFAAGLFDEAVALRERYDPSPARLLRDRLSRGMGGRRRGRHARRGDRDRHTAQRRVRPPPADMVPQRARDRVARRHVERSLPGSAGARPAHHRLTIAANEETDRRGADRSRVR